MHRIINPVVIKTTSNTTIRLFSNTPNRLIRAHKTQSPLEINIKHKLPNPEYEKGSIKITHSIASESIILLVIAIWFWAIDKSVEHTIEKEKIKIEREKLRKIR
ncbi:MAG TPA: hypothetical protein VLG50_04720 [Candidatus Saccharimonadales bacterium]|nr:hypothetical protein [Candidatus Saccharimonadales bacterium]